MIMDQWPKIKAELDGGRLSVMALIEQISPDPMTMGLNHQVLAYGYRLDGSDLSIRVYDPNQVGIDTVIVALSLADPQHTTAVSLSGGNPMYCFFQPLYVFAIPSADVAWEPLGGAFTSSPAICSWQPGRLDAFGRGTDNALWHQGSDGGWSGT
jgi:hypothetical protein